LGLIFNWLNVLSLSAFLVREACSGHIILQPTKNGNSNNNSSTKVIILGFDDSPKSQFTLAKPILDKYGFKGSFFVVYNYVNAGSERRDKTRMTWQDINTLKGEGDDIESHSMTHIDLDMKSQQNLIYEIGGSKQCLLDHVGVDPTIFAYPASSGHSNVTLVTVVSQYYDLARTGDSLLGIYYD
jgi:peptidoglycan/xylan/chitin deacetylase (PgdA/CDA1 family)